MVEYHFDIIFIAKTEIPRENENHPVSVNDIKRVAAYAVVRAVDTYVSDICNVAYVCQL